MAFKDARASAVKVGSEVWKDGRRVEAQGERSRYWIYHLLDAGDRPLYIGLTCLPRKRILSHRTQSSWWREVSKIRWYYGGARSEAREARRMEKEHIIEHQPVYNRQYRKKGAA